MLDFRPKKPSAAPAFSLDRAEQARLAGHRSRSQRGWWHALFLIIIIGTIIWVGLDWWRVSRSPEVKRIDTGLTAPPMRRPCLENLPAMPTAADIAGQAATATEALAAGAPPVWSGDNDAALLAWVQAINARDQERPPLPQGVDAKDLVLRHMRIGSAVMVSGDLIETAPAPLADGGPGWLRQLVMLEPDQYALLLSPPDAVKLAVGSTIQGVGRFVGFIHLPSAKSANNGASSAMIEVPFIVARRISPLGSMTDGQKPFWRTEGLFSMPNDIYENVDDERLVLETRPYYYLLGQTAQDRGTPEILAKAADANRTANAIHQDPTAHRGKLYTVRGKVFNAWVDQQVARDQPFGVERVVRIIFWSEDWSPLSLMVDGKAKTVEKLVTRVFEVAAISKAPPPAPGSSIAVTGRFLRMRAMEVKPDAKREALSGFTRQSDRSYTFLFVADGWTDLPPDEPAYVWHWWNWLLLAGVLSFAGWIVWRSWKSRESEGRVQESIRKLRSIRQRPGAKPAPTAADAPPPPASP